MEVTHDHSAINNPDELGLVVFTGGSDVSPSLYGASAHRSTFNNPSRDEEETAIARIAMKHNIPLAGICRGSQFLCVMAGGKLIQDISGHGATHLATARYPDGTIKEIEVSSSHHQMQYPFELPEDSYDVLAWSNEQRSSYYRFDAEKTVLRDGASKQLKMEPDVIWYPGINALAAQYHPEWMRSESDGFKYFQTLVNHYLKPLIEERDVTIIRGKTTDKAAG